MAYKIGDKCIGCGNCAANCPMEAISADGAVYKIDPEKCIGCGACAAGCPMEAISEE